MSFSKFLEESISSKEIKNLNKELDKKVILVANTLKIKDDGQIIVKDVKETSYEELLQKAKDYIDKNYSEEFDLKDKLNYLTYTEISDKEVDLFLASNSRTYDHKPLVCLIRKNIDDHGYIIGYHSNDLQKSVNHVGFPKEGYSIKILDGKFKASKVKLEDGIDAYVISPDYKIRNSNGCNELIVGKEISRIKHIRRKI